MNRGAPLADPNITAAQDELRQAAAARSTIRLMRRKLADQNLAGMGEVFALAVKHLETVRPAHRAAVDAELGALRAEIIATPGGAEALGPAVLMMRLAAAPRAPVAPAPAAVAPAPAAAPVPAMVTAPAASAIAARPLTDDEQANLSRARGRVSAARSAIESRRVDAVQPAIEEALAFLARAPEFATTELHRELELIRGQLAEEKRTQGWRKVTDEIERHLRSAENDAEYHHFDSGEEAVQRALRRLAEPDVASTLTAEQIAGYRQRAATVRARFDATLKVDALARVRPMLEELEREAPVDVFAGMDGHTLMRKERELASMRMRALTAIRHLAGDDPDVVKVVHRVAAADRRIAASMTNWNRLRREVTVVNAWTAVAVDTAGWTQEAPAAEEDVRKLLEPELPKTRLALHRARLLLAHTPRSTAKAGRPTSGHDATMVQDPSALTEQMFAAAGNKLAAAYMRLLDAAERMEPPSDQFLLRRMAQIAYNVDSTLAGTPHREAIVAVAQELDDRWRAALAAATKGQHELYEKLARQAERKWPELRDSTNALPFDPELLQPGKLVFLEGVFNRAGWDYSARDVELAVHVGNMLVGGACAPHVLKALQYAWAVHKLDVDDRVPWNLIGLVQNSGMLGVRTQLTVRDRQTGQILGEVDDWLPQPCMRIQIVGLQAGPVIVFDAAAAQG